MKKSNSKQKALGAFRKLGVVALITATMFFTACNQAGGGGNTGGGGGGGNEGGTTESEAPFVEGGVSLILSPDKLTIMVSVATADNSAVTVEGCNETTLESGKYKELHAKGTKVILKGNIVGFNCQGNRLTALNVQGCTALQGLYCYYNKLTSLNVQGCTYLRILWCYGNKLNAKAMTELLKGLPARIASDNAEAVLYTEYTGEPDGNHKDYNTPAELKIALEGAKKRNWKLKKFKASGNGEEEI